MMSTTAERNSLPKFIVCPDCCNRYDDQQRRRIIDSCGHPRCFTCLCKNSACPHCERLRKYSFLSRSFSDDQGIERDLVALRTRPRSISDRGYYQGRYRRDRAAQSCILEETTEARTDVDSLNKVDDVKPHGVQQDVRGSSKKQVSNSSLHPNENNSFIPLKYLTNQHMVTSDIGRLDGTETTTPIFTTLPQPEQDTLHKIIQEKVNELKMGKTYKEKSEVSTGTLVIDSVETKQEEEIEIENECGKMSSKKQEKTSTGTDTRIRETVDILDKHQQIRSIEGNQRNQTSNLETTQETVNTTLDSEPAYAEIPFSFAANSTGFPKVPFSAAVSVNDLSDAAFGPKRQATPEKEQRKSESNACTKPVNTISHVPVPTVATVLPSSTTENHSVNTFYNTAVKISVSDDKAIYAKVNKAKKKNAQDVSHTTTLSENGKISSQPQLRPEIVSTSVDKLGELSPNANQLALQDSLLHVVVSRSSSRQSQTSETPETNGKKKDGGILVQRDYNRNVQFLRDDIKQQNEFTDAAKKRASFAGFSDAEGRAETHRHKRVSKALSSDSTTSELILKTKVSRWHFKQKDSKRTSDEPGDVIRMKESGYIKEKNKRKSGYMSDGYVSKIRQEKEKEPLWSDAEPTKVIPKQTTSGLEAFPSHLSTDRQQTKSRAFSFFRGKFRFSWKKSPKKIDGFETDGLESASEITKDTLATDVGGEGDSTKRKAREKEKKKKKKKERKSHDGGLEYMTDSETTKKHQKQVKNKSSKKWGRKKPDILLLLDHDSSKEAKPSRTINSSVESKTNKASIKDVSQDQMQTTFSSHFSNGLSSPVLLRQRGRGGANGIHRGRTSGFVSDSYAYGKDLQSSSDSSGPDTPEVRRVAQFASATDSSQSDSDAEKTTASQKRSFKNQDQRALVDSPAISTQVSKLDRKLSGISSIDFLSKTPHEEKGSRIPRNWLFERADHLLFSEAKSGQSHHGLVIIGRPGSGKSTFLHTLVWPYHFHIQRSLLSQSSEIQWETLSNSIVGYHFCQNGDNETKTIFGFLRNMVSMLLDARGLERYATAFFENEQSRRLLSPTEKYNHPWKILTECVTNILKRIYADEVPPRKVLFVIDANEHRCVDCNPSRCILAFIANSLYSFPTWFKFLIAGSTSSLLDLRERGRFYEVCIDDISSWDIQKDLYNYADLLCKKADPILEHLTDKERHETIENIIQQSRGSFSFITMAFAYMQSQLVNSQVLPVDLPDTFVDLLVSFVTLKREIVPPMKRESIIAGALEVMLASSIPLTESELLSVLECSGNNTISRAEFLLCLSDLLSSQIIMRTRGDRLFLSDFARQLLHTTSKFGILDVNERNGHNTLSLYMMKTIDKESSDRMLQFARHLTFSRFGEDIPDIEERMVFKAWMFSHVYRTSTAAFINPENIVCPDMMVYHLLLHTGLVVSDVISIIGKHPLVWACIFDQSKIVQLLLDHGLAAKYAMEDAGVEAVLANSTDSLSVLLEYGVDVLHINQDGQSILVAAYEAKKLNALSMIFDSQWSREIETMKGDTALSTLCQACQNGNEDVAEVMLARRKLVDINKTDKLGRLPIVGAVEGGQLDLVKLLVAEGADIKGRDSSGITPVFLAVCKGALDILEWLVSVGADINDTDLEGRSLLMVAVKEGFDRIVRFLLSEGALNENKDTHGQNVMSLACSEGHPQIVHLLLQHDVDIEAVDVSGRTPLHHACTEGHIEVAKILLDYNADTEQRDARGLRPLECALLHKHYSCAFLLLESAARVGKYCWELGEKDIGVLETLIRYMKNKAKTLLKDKEVEDTKSLLHKALSKCRNSVYREREEIRMLRLEMHLLLSKAELIMQNGHEAQRQAAKALGMNPRSAEAFIARARARLALGSYIEAWEDLKEARNLSPTNDEIERLMTDLSTMTGHHKRPKSSAV